MDFRKLFPEKILQYAEGAAKTEDLPILLDQLDSYLAGLREAAEVGGTHRMEGIEELARRAREAFRQIQGLLRARGWTLRVDAKTWEAP